MTDVDFAYSARWAQFGPGLVPEATTTALELRDRELEGYVGSPAQQMAGRLFGGVSPFTDVTAGVADFRVRWERQRGQWVSFEAQGRGTGTALGGSFTSACVALPTEALPYVPAIGRAAVIGSAAVNLTAALVAPDQRNGVWCIPINVASSWGASTDHWFSVHVLYLAQE